MAQKKFKLSLLPKKFAICHLGKSNSIPSWLSIEKDFVSITRTENELSIVCPEDQIQGGVLAEKNWRVFKIEGSLGFVLTGIVAGLSRPLAEANISILYISSYETDHIMVEEKNLVKTIEILNNFCEIKKE